MWDSTLSMSDGDEYSAAVDRKTVLTSRSVEPVGKWFKSHWCRYQHHLGVSVHSDSSSDTDSENSCSDDVFEDDINYLRSLDPKDWKNQDHYAVLGLKKLRFKATDDDIKRAYRQKVLRHHPDKRRAAGEEVRQDDDYFTCITKAYEILGILERRRAYDSVDPEFDDDVPLANLNSRINFFTVFTHAFELNSRWSVVNPVPSLGEPDSSREHVEKFYSFWYNFDSWREFSYLDEEEKEKGQDREERKWIEKQNKIGRAKRKKEEMARIRHLVDTAYSCDPRIQKFKEDDKQKKLAFKKAKQEAARAAKEEEERVKHETLEREKREKEQAEAEEKAKRDLLKKEREAMKKALNKERNAFRTLCKANNYYTVKEAELVTHLTELDKLCELSTLEQLEDINKKLQGMDKQMGRLEFLKEVSLMNKKIEQEKKDMYQSISRTSSNARDSAEDRQWTAEELQLLIRAVNLFPAGTTQRWEVSASFINQHANNPDVSRTAKEVLAKARDLQSGDFSKSSLKDAINKQAYDNFRKGQKSARTVKQDEAQATERFDYPVDEQGLNIASWTAEEQRLLEQALKTYPASTADRWDMIASCIPHRSKKDCMKRYKELVEMVKAKKAAQAAAQKLKK